MDLYFRFHPILILVLYFQIFKYSCVWDQNYIFAYFILHGNKKALSQSLFSIISFSFVVMCFCCFDFCPLPHFLNPQILFGQLSHVYLFCGNNGLLLLFIRNPFRMSNKLKIVLIPVPAVLQWHRRKILIYWLVFFPLFSADPDDPLKTTDQTRPLGLIVWFLLSTYFHCCSK